MTTPLAQQPALGMTPPSPQTITSPLELTKFVDTMLNDLESKFDVLSNDLLTRLGSLSDRVDTLEASIAELMQDPTDSNNNNSQ